MNKVSAGTGKDHFDVPNVLAALGFMWREFGDFARAKAFHERALAIMERVYGEDHQRVAPYVGSC